VRAAQPRAACRLTCGWRVVSPIRTLVGGRGLRVAGSLGRTPSTLLGAQLGHPHPSSGSARGSGCQSGRAESALRSAALPQRLRHPLPRHPVLTGGNVGPCSCHCLSPRRALFAFVRSVVGHRVALTLVAPAYQRASAMPGWPEGSALRSFDKHFDKLSTLLRTRAGSGCSSGTPALRAKSPGLLPARHSLWLVLGGSRSVSRGCVRLLAAPSSRFVETGVEEVCGLPFGAVDPPVVRQAPGVVSSSGSQSQQLVAGLVAPHSECIVCRLPGDAPMDVVLRYDQNVCADYEMRRDRWSRRGWRASGRAAPARPKESPRLESVTVRGPECDPETTRRYTERSWPGLSTLDQR